MLYHTTPVDEITGIPALEKAGVRLLVKREDMNHPEISGNKWWKLKHNIDEALRRQAPVVTFGGAWSNHIYATAAACAEVGLRAVGIIRGEEVSPLNSTLAFAKARGMELHFIDRKSYRAKHTPAFQSRLRQTLGDFYLIPEGGTNDLAVQGCAEFAREQLSPIPFDHLFLAVGTGGTLAGVASGLNGSRRISGVSVLKDGAFLKGEVARILRHRHDDGGPGNWNVLTQYHLGGYAKTTADQLSFIREIQRRYDLPLDHVYTSKVLLAIIAEASNGTFRRGEVVLLLHTGGLQGSRDLHDVKGP